MPSLLNGLQLTYTPGVDFRVLRNAIAKQRAALGWSLDKLADEAHVNRATIHSIENVKREPQLKPKFETLEKLATAMNIRLSVHVDGDLQSADDKKHNPAPLETQGAAHAGSPVSSAEVALVELRRFVTRLGEVLTDAAAAADDEEHRPRSTTRADETGTSKLSR